MLFESHTFPSRRSAIVARRGLVATSQPLAAQVGLDILKAGGNAVDAAIATVATLCVVEPCSTGIGGDAFALIWMADEGKLVGLNASGPAPMALTPDLIRSRGFDTMPLFGGLAVTVPGSLRGWELAANRFGRFGLDRCLQPAIDYARGGFGVSQRIAGAWQRSAARLSVQPDSRRTWLPGGKAPQAAGIFRNPQFAQSLSTLATQGLDSFYEGEIGRKIVAAVQADGGVLALSDLAAYEAEWVDPISTPFGDGYRMYEIPPNGQGLTALLAMNLVDDLITAETTYGTADYYHLLMEAIKLAFADAETYIADPRHAPVPVAALLSAAYTQQRRTQLDLRAAQPPQAGTPPSASDTVYLTVADGEGNMVSWIQSLYMGFGSGLNAGDTGIQLQNRGANFTLAEGHFNQVAPGKRPYHTIIPGFLTRHGKAWSSFGVMGGFMQPQGHLQVGLNLTHFGMDPQTALDAPRFNWLKGMEFGLETAVPDEVRAELSRRGHKFIPQDQPMHYGGGQAIVRDPDTGVLIGGSEPRNDGAAVGW